LLAPVFDDTHPFLTFYFAVVLVAWACGTGPTLLCLLLGSASAAYFFLHPPWSLEIYRFEDQVALALFVFFGLVTAVLSEEARRARRKAERKRRQLEQEVAERKRAELALAREREGWRTTLASVGDGVLVTDRAGRVTFLNGMAEALTGWQQAEALGRSLDEVLFLLGEEDRRPVEGLVEKVIASEHVEWPAARTILIARDGTERPIDARAAPVPDDAGKVGGVVLVVRDITDRRLAEEFLRESEQRFAGFMQHLPGLAWIKDAQGRYVYANDAAEKVFRLRRADLYGKTDDEVFPPATAAQFKENDRRALTSGTAGVTVVEALEHEDGIVHYSIVSKFPIPGVGNRGALVGGTAIDITDRLRAEEALRQADQRKDEFLAMLAHELRNPLAPMRNAVQILRTPGANGGVAEQARAMIERQVQHLTRLVDDLLDVSRIMRGKVELRKQRVNLAEVVARAVETARPAIDAHEQHLEVGLPAGPVWLEADPVRLEQVLANLLHNSAKYTDPAGRIELTAQEEDGTVVVRVRDTGVGITAEMLPRIFDLFVQGDHSIARSQGGLGIGLTVVKYLVELHGGTVRAISAGPGKGSELVVRLPMLKGAVGPAPSAESTGDGGGRAAPCRRVLVVDDNADAAGSLALLLRLWGHEVRVAHDGLEAVRVAEEFVPEILLLDIGLPGLNGYEVAKRLRHSPRLARAVLVALTGYGQEEDRSRSREAGLDQHLVKPVEPDRLQRLLAGVPDEGP
jgi:PAS domain S-box-containing protein